MTWSRDHIAQRAARFVQDGQIVNLGIGIPTLVANHLDGKDVMLHSENGLLGMGPFPFEGEEDPQVINAGKQTVTVVAGGSTSRCPARWRWQATATSRTGRCPAKK
jgi:3-oxoacid CoA-transferase subunit B